MKLSDFLDVADDDDMVEVYADDGVTRPCEVKLVDAFQMSDWVGGILDVRDELEVYLDREVTGVATARLEGCGEDEVVAMRVFVEQKEGDGGREEAVRDKGVREVVQVQDAPGVPKVPDEVDRGDGGLGKGPGRDGPVEPGGGDQHDGHGCVKKAISVNDLRRARDCVADLVQALECDEDITLSHTSMLMLLGEAQRIVTETIFTITEADR